MRHLKGWPEQLPRESAGVQILRTAFASSKMMAKAAGVHTMMPLCTKVKVGGGYFRIDGEWSHAPKTLSLLAAFVCGLVLMVVGGVSTRETLTWHLFHRRGTSKFWSCSLPPTWPGLPS